MTRSIWLMCLLLGAAVCQDARGDDKVLVVHSYHKAFDWTREVDRAITSVLKAADVTHQVFFMDTKRRSEASWKQSAGRQAKALVAAYGPKVVIAVDDNAQTYFARDYVDRQGIQVIFCGVNADPDTYGYPAANVTGILERTYPDQALTVLKTLLPYIRGVSVVSDDSPSSGLVINRVKSMLHIEESGLHILNYDQPHAFSDWKKAIVDLNNDPRVDALLMPLYHTVQQAGLPVSMDARDVMAWTLSQTRKPLVGIGPFFIEHGGLLAVAVNPVEHGRVAAQMAIEILKGKTAADIPMVVNQEGRVLVNLKNYAHLPFDVSVDIEQVAHEIIR